MLQVIRPLSVYYLYLILSWLERAQWCIDRKKNMTFQQKKSHLCQTLQETAIQFT